MSLLLDALQRASKEKEKATAGAAGKAAPASATPAAPAAPPTKSPALELAIEPVPAVAPSAIQPPALATTEKITSPAPPPLALTLEPVSLPISEPMPTAFVAPSAAPQGTPPQKVAALEPKTTNTAQATQESRGLRIEPTSAQPVTPAEPPPAAPAPTPSIAAPAAPAAEQKPAPQPAPQPAPTAKPTASISSSISSSNTARDILNASANAAQPKSAKRTLALGVAAVLLGLVTGSFFLGVWDSAPEQPEKIARTQPALPPPPTETDAAANPPSAPVGSAPIEQGAATAPANAPAINGKVGAEKKVHAANATAQPTQSTPGVPVFAEKPRTPANRPSHPAPAAAQNRQSVSVSQATAPTSLETAYAALIHGRLDDAAEGYRRVLMGNPEERDALLGLAHIAHRQGRHAEARDLYRRVLRQDPENTVANAGMLSLLSESELPNAGGLARELSERNPRSAAAFATLGGIMAREGRLADAQQAFFKAAALEPDNGLHAYNLAVALDRLHKHEPAQSYYERAIALADKSGMPNSIPRETALQRLEQLRTQGHEVRPTAP